MKPIRQGIETISKWSKSIITAAAMSSNPRNFSKTIHLGTLIRYKKLTKKGFLEDFVIPAFFVLLVIGFALSFLIENTFINAATALLAGLVFGKACYHKSDYYMFHYVMLSTGFIIGYVVGNRSGDYTTVLFLFIIGLVVSFYVHKKGIL